MPRSPLLDGLRLTLRHPRPLLWTYAANAIIAWLASFAIMRQFADVTGASLASQRLIGGFDVGVFADATRRLGDGPSGAASAVALGHPIYLLLFFLLVPGTLLTYASARSLRLGTMLEFGLASFWSFVRIALLTLAVAAPTLALLAALDSAWNTHVDAAITGRPAFLQRLGGWGVLFLAVCLLRLFFDLVEVHAVARAQTLGPSGKPDRRIRMVLKPAWRSFAHGFLPMYLLFVALALLGALAVYLFSLSALHHLGQPRAWPTILLAQFGVFCLIFARFWQRAAETVHVGNHLAPQLRSNVFVPANPAPPPPLEPTMVHASTFPAPYPVSDSISPILPGPDSNPLPEPGPFPDPMPGPEPISPSLASPDPGVFHHNVPEKKDLLD